MAREDADWEVLALPPEIELSSKGKNQELNSIEEEGSGEKGDDRLCGFLNKCGAKGIKTWKRRWFVFEPRRCTLYYYKTPECIESFGHIDIAKSTFSIPPNPGNKGQFEIRCNDRVYQLQAADKDAMLFWVQQLKAERSKFMRLKCSMAEDSRPHSTVLRPTSGLLASNEEGTKQNPFDDLISFSDPVKKPASVGEASKNENVQPSSQSFVGNFSLTNIKTELKNWRKSTILTGEPVASDLKSETGEKSPTGLGQESKPAAPKTVRLRPNSKSYDFGFMGMAAGLKRRTFWGGYAASPIIDAVDNPCRGCEETTEILSILKEAIQIAEKEIKTRDEVVESLHEQLRYAVMNKPQESAKPEADPDSLEEKDCYIEKLSKMLKNQRKENEVMQARLNDKVNIILEYEAKVEVLSEMIKNKDDKVVALTNQIFTMENPEPAEDVLGESVKRQSSVQEDAEQMPDYQQWKESCAAYKEQNKLLNSEILELIKMQSMDEEILKEKNATNARLEAELCKIKSRYVILLKEFSIPLKDGYSGGDRDQDMIQHLLDDAINESTAKNTLEGANARRASDRYGFYEIIDTEDDDSLQSLAEKLDEKSSSNASDGSLEMSVGVRWENYLVAQGKKPITKSEEVKSLVRAGIPHEFRARVWQDLVSHYVQHEREVAGPGYFQSLLDEKQGLYTPAAKQIELDLLRTLPNNKYYDSVDSGGTTKLRKVLLAYSWHNPSVGYCQGLNRLGAIALLYLKEEDAFWCLVAIIEHLMPRDYYSRTLIGAQIDQRVFKELFDEKLPKLSTLLQQHYVDLSLLSFNWFLAIFVDIFPVEMTLRVWDTFLYEGNKVLFRYALAMFKSCEDDLLKVKESGEIFSFFRRVPPSRMNPHRISQIAFQQMNPFPKRNILTKRANYMPKLQAELAEFEMMRKDRRSKRENEDKEIFSDGDDDD